MADCARQLRLEPYHQQVLELAGKVIHFKNDLEQGESPRWLTMMGQSGTGKTHCAKWLWGVCRGNFDFHRSDYFERMIYWPLFIEELRQRFRDGMGTEPFLDLMNWPFLVLDDIGAEHDKSGFASEKLNMLIGRRVGKWTVITSNLNLGGIGNIDERISDRIIRERGNDWIEMNCGSYGMSKIP